MDHMRQYQNASDIAELMQIITVSSCFSPSPHHCEPSSPQKLVVYEVLRAAFLLIGVW